MSARRHIMWTLDEALHYIRTRRVAAFKHNYNLSLGGGVLSSGKSLHDLDIVCVPSNGLKATEENYRAFIQFLRIVNHEPVNNGRWNEMTRKWTFRTESGKLVDYFVTFNPGVTTGEAEV